MAKDTLSDITGLPDDLGIGDDLTRSEQRVSIRVDSRRYGKPMTVVEGLNLPIDEVESLASTLKSTLAVGGTATDEGEIELQGKHDRRLVNALENEGFDVEI